MAATAIKNLDDARALVGVELPPSPWWQISQAQITTFAECINDRQWIHVDPERAAAGPFGGTVAHGFLTLAMLTSFWESVVDTAELPMKLNYGLDRVRFPAPLRSGSRIRGRFVVATVEEVPNGVQVRVSATVECEGQPKPPCVAEMLLRLQV